MEYRMELVFEIADCLLYEISENGNLQLLKIAPLAIYVLKQYHLVVLQLGQWQYSLSQEIPVLHLTSQNKKMFAFPKNHGGNFGIVLGASATIDQEQILESILSQNCNYSIATPEQENQMILPNGDYQQQNIADMQEISTSKWIQGYIQRGGDMIRNGLIMGGNVIAVGIKNGGKLIKSLIQKPEIKQIDADSLAKVQMAEATSSHFLTLTQNQIEILLNNASSIGQELGNSMSNTSVGQMITNQKYYGDIRNVAKGSAHAVTAIYEGMFESLAIIARGLQTTTTSLVNAKYGQQACMFADQSMDTIANIGNIAFSFNNQVNKQINDQTQSHIRNF